MSTPDSLASTLLACIWRYLWSFKHVSLSLLNHPTFYLLLSHSNLSLLIFLPYIYIKNKSSFYYSSTLRCISSCKHTKLTLLKTLDGIYTLIRSAQLLTTSVNQSMRYTHTTHMHIVYLYMYGWFFTTPPALLKIQICQFWPTCWFNNLKTISSSALTKLKYYLCIKIPIECACVCVCLVVPFI